jgi:hypothetical protein
LRKHITPMMVLVALVTAASFVGNAKYGFGVSPLGFFGGK